MVILNGFRTDGDFSITIDDEAAKRTYVIGVINEIFDKDIKHCVKIKDVASISRKIPIIELIMVRCLRILFIFTREVLTMLLV